MFRHGVVCGASPWWCPGATRAHSSTAPKSMEGDFEGRWPPAERHVRQPPDHGFARRPFAAAAAAPLVEIGSVTAK